MVFRFLRALCELRGSTQIFLIAEKQIHQHTPAGNITPMLAAAG
jgi:hypothetical protein